MCGIVGILNLVDKSISLEIIIKMANVLKHRGPDDEGYVLINTNNMDYMPIGGNDTPNDVYLSSTLYSPKSKIFPTNINTKYNLAFGHRRLSILDLSPKGHQPMCNEDGTVWMVYNGEIYNYIEIRDILINKGHKIISNTDTEIAIHSYEEWGIDCLNKFNGMWAFALWDSSNRVLFCARDKFGIKPLYYYLDTNKFLFSSEIKGLLVANIKRKPNDKVIYDYLVNGLVDYSENTFFEGIKQLKPGHYLLFDLSSKNVEVKRYYDIKLSNKKSILPDKYYSSKFRHLLDDSVRLRLRSDVPVGFCLSGGLDSSSIVCIATDHVDKKVRTFSGIYEEEKYSEKEFIDGVVKKTSIYPEYVIVRPQGLLDSLKDIIYYLEEPSCKGVYAQWKVFELIKKSGTKVVLDGQGGDELLAGYDWYIHIFYRSLIEELKILKFLKELYSFVRLRTDSLKQSILYTFDILKLLLLDLLPLDFRTKMLRSINVGSHYWLNKHFAKSINIDYSDLKVFKHANYFDRNWYLLLTKTNLPALLRYEDKISMAHSVETRLPFLDYRLVEFAFSMPEDKKISVGITKYVLRDAMYGILPEIVRNRMDKKGFYTTPESIWYASHLKNYIYKIINSNSFKMRKYFDVERVKEGFETHCKGKKNLEELIWRWINLELWMQIFIDDGGIKL